MPTSDEAPPVTLESLEDRVAMLQHVMGVMLLLIAGYPFPREMLVDVAKACGIVAPDMPIPPPTNRRAH